MAFCSNCGAEVQGRFCAKCGSPISAGAASGTAAGGPPPPSTHPPSAPPPPAQPQQSYTPPQAGYNPPQQGYTAPGYTPPQQSYAPPQQAYTPPQPGYGQQQGYQQGYTAPATGSATSQAGGMTDNLASALCYVLGLLTGILFLVLAPYNQNRLIRFHAFQSIFLHLGVIATWIALFVLTGFLRLIPFMGVMLSFVLYPIVGLGFFVLWLVMMYKAYNGERWVLPVIGPLAEKQA